jgi:hypothetical protein
MHPRIIMRAKTVTHVEYEIFMHILQNIDVSEVKEMVVPMGDTVAEKRFNQGLESAAKLIHNLCLRRQHRLPSEHVDYNNKE